MTHDDDPTTAGGKPPEPPNRGGGQSPPPPPPARTAPPTARSAEPIFPESVLTVVQWPDPVLDQLGHDPRSGYVERFWLPVLGPSCLLLIRRLAAELERRPEGFDVESARWAKELGVGMKGGQHSPFWRAVERACRFGAARRNGHRLALRRRLPPLSSRQVQRLPPSLRSEHNEWAAARLDRPKRATVTHWTPRTGPDTPPQPGDDQIEFDDAA